MRAFNNRCRFISVVYGALIYIYIFRNNYSVSIILTEIYRFQIICMSVSGNTI